MGNLNCCDQLNYDNKFDYLMEFSKTEYDLMNYLRNKLNHGQEYERIKDNMIINRNNLGSHDFYLYKGDIITNKKEGYGIIFKGTGLIYEGFFINDIPELKGYFLLKNDWTYYGEVLNGKINGKGIFYNSKNEDIINCYTKNEQLDGYCKIKLNNFKIRGLFKNNNFIKGSIEKDNKLVNLNSLKIIDFQIILNNI